METFWDINKIYPQIDSVLTVGTFDGIHKGHQEIIKELGNRARSINAKSTLVTFEPHPGLVVGKRGIMPLNLLTTIEEKIDVLDQIGLDRLLVTNFTNSFASMSAEEFVTEILLKKLRMKQIVIGHDHSFGKDRRGNFDLLVAMGKEYGFEVDAIKPISSSDNIVSSTRIRELLYEGNVLFANELLGRNFSLRGQVVSGEGRGRLLGYPTANIRPFSQYKLVPREGVYATRILIKEQIYDSVTYIGPRPTFNLNKKVIETFIFDFNQDIYNQQVEIYFSEFIREDIKFNSVEELITKIKSDNELVQKVLKAY